MKRNLISVGSLLAAAFCFTACGHSGKAAQTRPNVIILLTDDVGYGDLGFNGEPLVETPNADRLAAEGLRLTNCHAASATSTPSRFGLLTGMYPWRREGTGIAAGNAGMIILPEQTTLADLMSQAGYHTAAIGKWHLGLGETARQDWNGLITPNLSDIGFQYSYIMAATADRVPCVFIENGRVVGLDPSDPISVSYERPFEGELIGRDHPEMLRIHPSEGHDMAIIDSIPRIGYMIGGNSALWHDEDIADSITEHAVRYITAHQHEPFFLYLGTNDIHVPRVPHARFRGSTMGPRGDAIRQLDYTIGRLTDCLRSLGLDDNTLLILTSDNGPVVDDGYADRAVELLGDHRPWGDYSGGKYSIFEAGTRVPCIVRWPGHVRPGVSDVLTSQIDLFASLAVATGIQSVPEGSRLPSVMGDTAAAPDSRNHWASWSGGTTGRAYAVEQNLHNTLALLTADGYKYILPSHAPRYNPGTNTWLGNDTLPQLYYLPADPREKTNLAPSNPAKADSLHHLLLSEQAALR